LNFIKSYQGEVSVDIGVQDAVSEEPYLGSLIRQLLSAILCCSLSLFLMQCSACNYFIQLHVRAWIVVCLILSWSTSTSNVGRSYDKRCMSKESNARVLTII
jgi:hypothetical protein